MCTHEQLPPRRAAHPRTLLLRPDPRTLLRRLHKERGGRAAAANDLRIVFGAMLREANAGGSGRQRQEVFNAFARVLDRRVPCARSWRLRMAELRAELAAARDKIVRQDAELRILCKELSAHDLECDRLAALRARHQRWLCEEARSSCAKGCTRLVRWLSPFSRAAPARAVPPPNFGARARAEQQLAEANAAVQDQLHTFELLTRHRGAGHAVLRGAAAAPAEWRTCAQDAALLLGLILLATTACAQLSHAFIAPAPNYVR